MKYGECVKCHKQSILNSKSLCPECVWQKNHPGQTRLNYINPVSKKKSQKISQKIETYKKMDEVSEKVCSGCGRSDRPLSHSHLIPESYDDRFSADPRNIKYHCLDLGGEKGCHRKWESHDLEVMKELLDFEENMEYIREVCPSYYNQLITKVNLNKE